MFAAVLLENYTGEFCKMKLFNSADERDTWMNEVNHTEDENHPGYCGGAYWYVVEDDDML